ncbi:MAG: hypothetical protein PHS44_07990 [Candidatus Dojkabacteria bacterium]|nr:hypothetical protein [Candidatus Dojkabacteria bacterium]
MAQPVTTDNMDDIIRNTLKTDLDYIKSRLYTLENMVREDLAVDKTQRGGSPDTDRKIESMYQRIEELKFELVTVKNLVDNLSQVLNSFIQKYEQAQDRYH